MKQKTNYRLLSKNIVQSLRDYNSETTRKKWADHLITEKLNPEPLLHILLGEPKTAMYFSWLLGDVCERQPQMMRRCAESMFRLRSEVRFANFDRSLAKLFYLAGIPQEIEG